jgi:AraC-like DNA-binding protein
MCQLIALGCATRGIAPELLLQAAGLQPAELADPDARVPRSREVRLWAEAVHQTGDLDFGLHLAEQVGAGDLGGVGFAVRSSATLGEAYGRVRRYLALLNQDIGLEVVALGHGDVALRHVPPTLLPPPRQAVECFMALLHIVGRRGLGSEFELRGLELRHGRPESVEVHRRVFDVIPRFSAPHDALIFAGALLDRPQCTAEPALGSVLDRHLADLLRLLPPTGSFAEQVRGGLLRELERGEPELERLARRLHMSPRSLQRRLQREGTSLKLLTAELRRELAVRHLGEPHESIGEIAFLLGFSEPSTFHRAFKRWTGMTPIEYREKHRIFGAPGP